MCTSIAMKTKSFYFGRNMDWDQEFDEHVVITPGNFPVAFRKAGSLLSHYALYGMAAVVGGYPLYAEAANEKGLCMAGLNFPGNAFYAKTLEDGKTGLAPFELIPWLLGQCASVAEAKQMLSSVQLLDIPFSEALPLSPLHWHIADATGSLVLEATENGTCVYENPAGVLTNNPPFPFHLTNLAQYLNLTADTPENVFSAAGVRPFGKGLGSVGLPGDFSPASRFVKASYLLFHTPQEKNEEESVSHFFHLLDAVAMPDGSVASAGKRNYITTYSSCISAGEGIYYYKTCTNNQLTAVRLLPEDSVGTALKEFPLRKKQQLQWETAEKN